MCRNIRTLHNFEPPATTEEIHASALQYVRKISGSTKPSQANEEAFNRAVEEVAAITTRLLDELVTERAAEEPRGRGRQGPRPRGRALRDRRLTRLRVPEPAYGDGPVALRLIEPGDAEEFLAGFSDPVVHQNTYGGRLAPTRAAVEAYLGRVQGRLDDGEALILAAILREDGSFLGTTLLFGFEPGGRAEVGFWLGSHARGRGLGKPALQLTLRWGFAELVVKTDRVC